MLLIILNVADDDDRAFVEKIYVEYEKKLYMISNEYLNNHYDAQDCVHDTVKLIIEGIDKFKMAQDRGYLDKLITIVCRNRAINILRTNSRRYKYEQSLAKYNSYELEYEDVDIPDYDSCVDKIYISEQNCEYLHELINNLDDKYRDIVLLKSLGFDYTSIATLLGISEELARKRYSRAKKLLWKMGGKELHVE